MCGVRLAGLWTAGDRVVEVRRQEWCVEVCGHDLSRTDDEVGVGICKRQGGRWG